VSPIDPAFAKILERIRTAGSLLCLTHLHADGDGIGAMVALARTARRQGITARLLLQDGTPRRYRFLLEGEEVLAAEDFPGAANEAELIVILDTASRSQLLGVADHLDAVREKIVVIDHHVTADDIAKLRWTDTAACAVGLMVQEILDGLGWPIEAPEALALAAAIASDTGWMRFSNTDARCLRAMARLLELDVQPDELYDRIFQADRPHRLRLMERMLSRLELYCDDQLAVMSITREDFEHTGAREDETENLINEAMRLASVEAAVLLVENPERLRVSLRSRGKVNVAKVAAKFGGGGHARAAGLKSEEDLDELKQRLITAIAEALGTGE
jgi:phosphoesterase RecJ-like protein